MNSEQGRHDFRSMGEEDQELLQKWIESLVLLDPRYQDKRIFNAGARAMLDESYRDRISKPGTRGTIDHDPRSWLGGEMGEQSEAPDEIEVRFHSNDSGVVHVVLPPRAGDIESRPTKVRDALRSRTSVFEAGWFRDDWNLSDAGNDPTIVVYDGPGGFNI